MTRTEKWMNKERRGTKNNPMPDCPREQALMTPPPMKPKEVTCLSNAAIPPFQPTSNHHFLASKSSLRELFIAEVSATE